MRAWRRAGAPGPTIARAQRQTKPARGCRAARREGGRAGRRWRRRRDRRRHDHPRVAAPHAGPGLTTTIACAARRLPVHDDGAPARDSGGRACPHFRPVLGLTGKRAAGRHIRWACRYPCASSQHLCASALRMGRALASRKGRGCALACRCQRVSALFLSVRVRLGQPGASPPTVDRHMQALIIRLRDIVMSFGVASMISISFCSPEKPVAPERVNVSRVRHSRRQLLQRGRRCRHILLIEKWRIGQGWVSIVCIGYCCRRPRRGVRVFY